MESQVGKILELDGTVLVQGSFQRTECLELLHSNTGLSFWGGIDPRTGLIVDHTHDLYLKFVSPNMALAIPSGRGSCTGSQVLLELILNRIAPGVIILAEADPILAVGAIIAQNFFHKRDKTVPTIINLGREQFNALGKHVRNGAASHISISAYSDENTSMPFVKVYSGYEKHVRPKANTSIMNHFSTQNYMLNLTSEEESILNGTHPKMSSKAHQYAFETLVKVAQICGAKEFFPIHQAHIDGCTYIGPGGLEFAQMLVKHSGRVSVPTTLNSISIDQRRWRELGVDAQSLGLPASQLAQAYVDLGARVDSFTCAPYLLHGESQRPNVGDHIAWGESNAVVYANSVWGARTLKYADYIDICAALVGRVPAHGAHLDEGRRPGIILDAKLVAQQVSLHNDEVDLFFPLLGYVCGKLSNGHVPLIVGLDDIFHLINDDHLKAFCAAFGTTGSAPLFHMAGITPEAQNLVVSYQKFWRMTSNEHATLESGAVIITIDHMNTEFHALDSATETIKAGDDNIPIGLVALGNPHLSISECEKLASMVSKEGVAHKSSQVKLISTLGRIVYEQASSKGFIEPLKKFGMHFINDTCWCMLTEPVVPPLDENQIRSQIIMTNSAKYAHYAPGLVQKKVKFASLAMCLRSSETGFAPRDTRPKWLKDTIHRRCFSSARNIIFHQKNCFAIIRNVLSFI